MALHSDDFNRVDQSLGGSPNWYSTDNALVIKTNTLFCNSSTASGAFGIWELPMDTDNHRASVTLGTMPIANGVKSGVVLRSVGNAAATTDHYEVYYRDTSSINEVVIAKVVAGTTTIIASVTYVPASNETLSGEISGSTITVRMNGVAVLTATDTSIAAGKYAGVRLSGLDGAIDNWTAEDINVAPPPSATSNGPTVLRRENGSWTRRKVLFREGGSWAWEDYVKILTTMSITVDPISAVAGSSFSATAVMRANSTATLTDVVIGTRLMGESYNDPTAGDFTVMKDVIIAGGQQFTVPISSRLFSVTGDFYAYVAWRTPDGKWGRDFAKVAEFSVT